MREFWDLYITFARIGAFTFGGGLTMLPLLQAEVVEKKQWATGEELMDYYAIGQCTPGIIAVNTATFIGYKRKGIWGGIIATLGIVTPSLIIITTIASFLTAFAQTAAIQSAFAAIRVAVAVLVLNTVIKMWKTNIKGTIPLIISLCALAATLFLKVSPISVVIVSICFGFIMPRIKGRL